MCYHDIYSQSLRSATSKLEYRAVKLEQKELGLSKSVLDDLRRHATTIIHVTSSRVRSMIIIFTDFSI